MVPELLSFLLGESAGAFALSFAILTFSDRDAIGFVAAVLVIAWIVPGSLTIQPRVDVIYPPASPEMHEAASLAAQSPGALATVNKLVLPAHREWVYQFPNPFPCLENQLAYFLRSGPAPDVVITERGWQDDVSASDFAAVQQTLSTHYEVTRNVGAYTVRELIPGSAPPLVSECLVVSADG